MSCSISKLVYRIYFLPAKEESSKEVRACAAGGYSFAKQTLSTTRAVCCPQISHHAKYAGEADIHVGYKLRIDFKELMT